MTNFLQDNENRFGQAKKDYKQMTNEPQPEPKITEAEVSMMDSNAMLAKVLLYLQDNTLLPHEKIDLLAKLKIMGDDLQGLRTKIGESYKAEMCKECEGEGVVVDDVEPDRESGRMVGSVCVCTKCNGTGEKV